MPYPRSTEDFTLVDLRTARGTKLQSTDALRIAPEPGPALRQVP
jgi:hypothetical protein